MIQRILEGLNPRQRQAVEATEGCIRVVAGAGSGKTKTLTRRYLYLAEALGVSTASILCVTFTNKAAAEMRERLSQRFAGRKAMQGMTIGTFHSIALMLLRRTRPGLTVLDETGALSVAGDIVNGMALNMTPGRFLKEIEKRRAGEACGLSEETLELWKQRLIALNAATFDDLLTDALNDPLEPPFAHLLVDEYQDVNAIQRALTKKWSGACETLFVIGDADQSIYGFRGADAACFERLLAEYPDTELIALKKNYRSAPEILACALPLIEHNGGKREMEAGRGHGGLVRRIPVSDEYAEGIVIAKEIGRMVGGMDMIESSVEAGGQIGFSDIAILYRTHRQAEAIEKCLAAEGILPGGLNVQRKAKYLYEQKLTVDEPALREFQLIAAFAYAVAEQNADNGTVVTAPTCGACGVLPAVLKYAQITKGYTDEQIIRGLATAGIIGNLTKRNASISGAEAGCQAEIGTACSMAAAALAELYQQDLDQVEYAAEVAMEHHLGLTCDPICGLVQIPCIERNAVAAMRAMNACNLSYFLTGSRNISYDMVCRAMHETGINLNHRFRETSEGGLAKIYARNKKG